MFDCKPGHHPQVLKEHLKQNLSLETLIILDKILGYSKKYDKILDDLMWKTVSSKIKKYNPFMANINITKFKTLLKEIIVKWAVHSKEWQGIQWTLKTALLE